MSFVLSPISQYTPFELHKYGYEDRFFVGQPPLTLERVRAKLAAPSITVVRNERRNFEVQYDGKKFVTPGLTQALRCRTATSKYTKNLKGPEGRMGCCAFAEYNRKMKFAAGKGGGISVSKKIDMSLRIIKKIQPCSDDVAKALSAEVAALPVINATTVKKIWQKHKMQLVAGILLDEDVKRGTKDLNAVKYAHSLNVLECLATAGYTVVAVDVPVTSTKRPGAYQHCKQCKRKYDIATQLCTEIDLVCFHEKTKKVLLVELKGTGQAGLPRSTSNLYRQQSWLSWIMFANTYPTLAPYTESCILVYSFGERVIRGYRTIPMKLYKALYACFPFLRQWCEPMIGVMCPVGKRENSNVREGTHFYSKSALERREAGIQRCEFMPAYEPLHCFVVEGGQDEIPEEDAVLLF
ncbi:ORF118 [Ranid herpesvirus 2]|uniref:ORF118 n=1 Tax=Ranid herpesvirus 2 TaxID=389214 RepID=Q14VY8_9VIRU|nr:ORF118 [Ranid herpesvirus 2]ABG25615.1 ORF118 [Ranid herpesvirus 2]